MAGSAEKCKFCTVDAENLTDLIIRRHYFTAHPECTRFHPADVKHITVRNLNVSDLELRNVGLCSTIYHNATCIIFLATSFRIEICAIQKNAEGGMLWSISC